MYSKLYKIPNTKRVWFLEIVISSNNSQAWFPELGVRTFFPHQINTEYLFSYIQFDLFRVNHIEHPSRNNKKPCWEAISVTFRVSPQCHYRITHANANACYSITWMIQDDTGFESTSNQKGATYNVSVYIHKYMYTRLCSYIKTCLHVQLYIYIYIHPRTAGNSKIPYLECSLLDFRLDAWLTCCPWQGTFLDGRIIAQLVQAFGAKIVDGLAAPQITRCGRRKKAISPLQFARFVQRLRYDSQNLKGSWINGAAFLGTILKFSNWNLKPWKEQGGMNRPKPCSLGASCTPLWECKSTHSDDFSFVQIAWFPFLFTVFAIINWENRCFFYWVIAMYIYIYTNTNKSCVCLYTKVYVW